MRKSVEKPKKLYWRDYFQIITTFIIGGLGIYIIFQTIFIKWTIGSLLFGLLLSSYATFRLRMIRTYFNKGGMEHRNGI